MAHAQQMWEQEAPTCGNFELPPLIKKEQLNTIITNKNGSPDYLAINLYFDTLRSWYNPKSGYRKDGNVYHINKLKTPGVFLDYERLAEIHGCSKEAIRQKIVKLEYLKLVHRSFQHKETVTTKSYNQLIVYVWKDTPHFYNPMGVNSDQVPTLRPQTNHEYIKKRYGKSFAFLAPQNKGFCVEGGIQAWLGTKELNNTISLGKDIDLGSNFLKNFESKNQEEISTSKIINFPTRIKKRLPNQRRKPTNLETKAKVICFKQYEQPRMLAEHYPLTTEQCLELQRRSGREFSLNAMNEILLDMSRKPKESAHKFPSKAAFMAYMSEVYRNEARDAVKTANMSFKILTRATQTELIQHTSQAEQDSFFAKIEDEAIFNRNDKTQYKAKLVNTMPLSQAYNFVSNMKTVRKVGKILEIAMNKQIELTEFAKEILLAQANAVGGYSGVERLEFALK